MGPTNRSTEPLDRLGALSHAEGLATEPALDLSVPHSLSAPVCCHATCLRATHRQAADRCDLPTAPCLRADTHRQAAGQTGAQAARRSGQVTSPRPIRPACRQAGARIGGADGPGRPRGPGRALPEVLSPSAIACPAPHTSGPPPDCDTIPMGFRPPVCACLSRPRRRQVRHAQAGRFSSTRLTRRE